MASEQRTRNRSAWRWTIVAICVLGLAAIGALVFLNLTPGKNVSNYAECKAAGGNIAESYPEQCIIDGKTFVNNDANTGNKTNTDDPDGYVGLQEQDALDKAKAENKPARVVKRNGEDLAVTMDYAKGRLNLTVNNGIVEKVDIE